jgi:hypothetical protein
MLPQSRGLRAEQLGTNATKPTGLQPMNSILANILSVVTLGAVTLGAGAVTPVAAAEVQMREGVVVSATVKQLVMSDTEGKQHTLMLDEMTKVTIHGKPGRADELKLGMPIRAMLDAKGKVLTIATIDEQKGDGPDGPASLGRQRLLPAENRTLLRR